MEIQYDCIVIGAGFAGICAGIKLKENSFNDFIILERNAHIGGTWYENVYPGAACDVESHLYSYSFEMNPNWSSQFAPQKEILSYMNHCVDKYELRQHLRLNSSVVNARYCEVNCLWELKLCCGTILKASKIISCTGGLSRPSLPNIKGIHNFKGKKMHTAQWDLDFDLTNKVVAVIGTGASSIQVIPAIVPVVRSLTVFQRTAHWIMPRFFDVPISAFWKGVFNRSWLAQRINRVFLYWGHEVNAFGFIGHLWLMKLFGRLTKCYIRAMIPAGPLRDKVTPKFIFGCKRVLLSNDYYPALCQPHVTLVCEGIREVTEQAVVTEDGVSHPCEVLLLATGFSAAENIVIFPTLGSGGVNMQHVWGGAAGAEAYVGTCVSGFPNMFLVVGPNTGLGHSSMLLMIEAQIGYIMSAFRHMATHQLRAVDVRLSEQQQYNQQLQQRMARSVWQRGGCTSWYQAGSTGKNTTLWPGFTFSFMRLMKTFDVTKYNVTR